MGIFAPSNDGLYTFRFEKDVMIMEYADGSRKYRGIIEEYDASNSDIKRDSQGCLVSNCLPEKKLPWPRKIADVNNPRSLQSLLETEDFADHIVDDPAFQFYRLLNVVTTDARYEVSRDSKYGDVTAKLYVPYTIAYKNGRLYGQRNIEPPRRGDGFAEELGKTAFDEALGMGVTAALGEAVVRQAKLGASCRVQVPVGERS